MPTQSAEHIAPRAPSNFEPYSWQKFPTKTWNGEQHYLNALSAAFYPGATRQALTETMSFYAMVDALFSNCPSTAFWASQLISDHLAKWHHSCLAAKLGNDISAGEWPEQIQILPTIYKPFEITNAQLNGQKRTICYLVNENPYTELKVVSHEGDVSEVVTLKLVQPDLKHEEPLLPFGYRLFISNKAVGDEMNPVEGFILLNQPIFSWQRLLSYLHEVGHALRRLSGYDHFNLWLSNSKIDLHKKFLNENITNPEDRIYFMTQEIDDYPSFWSLLAEPLTILECALVYENEAIANTFSLKRGLYLAKTAGVLEPDLINHMLREVSGAQSSYVRELEAFVGKSLLPNHYVHMHTDVLGRIKTGLFTLQKGEWTQGDSNP